MTIRLYRGDTPDPVQIAGPDESGVHVSVDSGGWSCRTQILDYHRNVVVDERLITETIDVDGILHFQVKMLIQESEALTPGIPAGRSPTHFWSIEIKNIGLDYCRTVEIEFDVIETP